jgi:hypothetical protein
MTTEVEVTEDIPNDLEIAAGAYYNAIRTGFLSSLSSQTDEARLAVAKKELPAWEDIDSGDRFGLSLMLSITLAEFAAGVNQATEADYADYTEADYAALEGDEDAIEGEVVL